MPNVAFQAVDDPSAQMDEQVALLEHGAQKRLQRGEYVVELGGRVKTSLLVNAPL